MSTIKEKARTALSQARHAPAPIHSTGLSTSTEEHAPHTSQPATADSTIIPEVWTAAVARATAHPSITIRSIPIKTVFEYLSRISEFSQPRTARTVVENTLIDRYPILWTAARAQIPLPAIPLPQSIPSPRCPSTINTSVWTVAAQTALADPRITIRSVPATIILEYIDRTSLTSTKSTVCSSILQNWLRETCSTLWEQANCPNTPHNL